MSGVFSKSMLHLGTYHAPQGVVVVTPERLKHWEAETARLQSAGYAIPSHFDHGSTDDLLKPIEMDVLNRGTDRSAQATVGKLRSFKVMPDGNSAEVIVETLTPAAKEAVESNAVFLSPVIYPQWKDGAGNEYRDVITSFDLVDHPVDYSQTSFVPAVRMGLKEQPKPFLLSIQMADENDPAVDNADTPAADDNSPPPAEDKTNDTSSSAKLSGIIAALANLKVVLAPDTDGTNFIDRLESALLTAAAQDEPESEGEEPIDTTPITQADPQIATMSLRIKQLEDDKIQSVREQKKAQLQTLLEQGRLTPAEHSALSNQLQAVKMSVVPGKEVSAGEIDVWLKARAGLPVGSLWTDEQRTKAATKLSLAEAPESWSPQSSLTPKAVEAGVEALTRDIKRAK